MSRFTWDFKGTKPRRRERVNDKKSNLVIYIGQQHLCYVTIKWEFSGLKRVDVLRWGVSQLRSYEPHFLGMHAHKAKPYEIFSK